MEIHKSINDPDFQLLPSDFQFNYQEELTIKLDNSTSLFNQDIINEIVLWKVNRFSLLDEQTLNLINEVDPNEKILDENKTRKILLILLRKKGIQLAMASTILRFRNKSIYQIIDQRVYRILYSGKKLKLNYYQNDKNLNLQIDIYFKYLRDLNSVCSRLKIPFDKSDRILFMADKRLNKEIKLDNY